MKEGQRVEIITNHTDFPNMSMKGYTGYIKTVQISAKFCWVAIEQLRGSTVKIPESCLKVIDE